MSALERKRPAIAGPGANPKANMTAQSDGETIPPTHSRVNRLRESLTLLAILRMPRIYRHLCRGPK